MILWFVIFEFGLRTSVYEFFLELQSWSYRVKMCDIPRAYLFDRWSQKSTLLAICSDTPAQLQSDECVRVVPPFRTKFLSTAFKQWRSSAMPLLRCLNKELVVVLASLHTNRDKLKGSEDFNWNNIGLPSLWFLCDFSGTHDFGWWFLADLLSGHVSTIILMRKCDSKYREIVFSRKI